MWEGARQGRAGLGQAAALLENLKLIYFSSYCGHNPHRSRYLTRSQQLCVSLSISLSFSSSPSLSFFRFTQSVQTFAINFDFAFSAFPIFAHLYSVCLSAYLPILLHLSPSLFLYISSTDCSVAQSTNYAALTSPRAIKIGMPKVRRKTFQFNYQRPGAPDCHLYTIAPHLFPSHSPLHHCLMYPLGQHHLQFRFGFALPAIWLAAFSANLFAKFACWRHRHRRQRNLRGCRLRQQ